MVDLLEPGLPAISMAPYAFDWAPSLLDVRELARTFGAPQRQGRPLRLLCRQLIGSFDFELRYFSTMTIVITLYYSKSCCSLKL